MPAVNVADLGTKILDKFTFQKLRGMLMFDMEYLSSARLTGRLEQSN